MGLVSVVRRAFDLIGVPFGIFQVKEVKEVKEMKSMNAVSRLRCATGSLTWLLCGALLSLVAACASTGKNVSGWDQVTVGPGVTGNCQSNPCRVFFQMPKGSGTYKVTGDGMTYGTYPAGETVNLGSLFESNSIKVPDAGVAPAYVYVPRSL